MYKICTNILNIKMLNFDSNREGKRKSEVIIIGIFKREKTDVSQYLL